MSDRVDSGPLRKAVETVKVFTERRPSLDELWASRDPDFDRLHAVLPSTATVGEEVTLTLQAWDGYERLYPEFEGRIDVDATDPAFAGPASVRFPADHAGVARADLSFGTPGVHYLRFDYRGRRFVSNPVRVTTAEPDRHVYWGDLHLHSHLSDGTGSIETGMRFGRDVMALDVVAYTDHDTMGFFIPPQLQRRRMHRRYFDRMKSITKEFHDPGSFVTLFGYEWTKQPNNGGHVNVYFDGVDDAELFDSIAAETNTYEALWDRLRRWRSENEGDVLTVPHHPAEAMYPFDFAATEYDDDLAPLVEVYSQWGSSERPGAEGNRFPLAMGQGEVKQAGHYAQDALRLGYRVGLVASADYHGPHPGHSLIHADPHLPSLREWLDDGLGWANIWRVWNEQSYPGAAGLLGPGTHPRGDLRGAPVAPDVRHDPAPPDPRRLLGRGRRGRRAGQHRYRRGSRGTPRDQSLGRGHRTAPARPRDQEQPGLAERGGDRRPRRAHRRLHHRGLVGRRRPRPWNAVGRGARDGRRRLLRPGDAGIGTGRLPGDGVGRADLGGSRRDVIFGPVRSRCARGRLSNHDLPSGPDPPAERPHGTRCAAKRLTPPQPTPSLAHVRSLARSPLARVPRFAHSRAPTARCRSRRLTSARVTAGIPPFRGSPRRATR
ncbi:DUF3604 domain-containing protein [Salinigranum sp. GCM10025319]|uniref:DUF3604 domain-containing protein n=1 Tax=Salinigranum sp. GCM10025319 TaxID=3252687 RepID=UPI00360F974B